MKTVLGFFVSVLLVVSGVQSKKDYKDHKVVSFRIENEQQLKEVQNLEQESGFTFWDPPVQTNMKIDLVVQPSAFAMFEEVAKMTGIEFKVKSDNFQSWINDEKPIKRSKAFGVDKYNRLDEIYEFMEIMEMVSEFTSVDATVITIGESYEGRPIKLMKIVRDVNNPSIFIEANIHAREWISSATAMWIMNELLTKNNAVTSSVNWYILPVTNPDGYEYSHDHNRLWRKTRSVHNIFCRGADPNRNFGFNFRMGGSSKVACTDTYSGPSAFSEKETKALMDFYETIANETEAYISFHSAAQTMLYPMGHTTDTELVPNVQDLHDIAEATVTALTADKGTAYTFGNVVEELYVASGSSVDHAYGVFGTQLAYTIEFRAGEGTESRFILPEDEIVPNSQEVYAGLIEMILKAKELGYFKVLN